MSVNPVSRDPSTQVSLTSLSIPKFPFHWNQVREQYPGSRRTTDYWRIRTENLLDKLGSGYLKVSTVFKEVEYQVQCRFREGRFYLRLDPLNQEARDGNFHTHFILFNQDESQKTIEVTPEEPLGLADMLSKEELEDPDNGWIVDGFVVVAQRIVI